MEKLYLIDSSCYIYRAFYAIPNLRTSLGFPTNAVYGFTTMLMNLCMKEKPGYIACAFDLPAPTFRHRAYPEYKANRPQMPEDLQKQIPVIKEIVSALHISALEIEGYEADDILATVAKIAGSRGVETFIFSKDKDCLQIACPEIKIVKEENTDAYDSGKVRQIYGVDPSQLVDVMALSGDRSDNIQGIPGVGIKTAARLVQQFGGLEEILCNVEKIQNLKLRENLKNFSGRANLNKKLVLLDSNVPLKFDFDSLRAKEQDRVKLSEIFRRLEFKKLLERI